MSAVVVVIIVVVVLALVALGLIAAAIALTLSWLRSTWREFRSAPMVSGLTRTASVAMPLVQYRDVLRLAPAEATAQTMRIQRKALALERVRDHLAAEDRYHVEETTRRYLPDTMNAYRLAVTGADAEQRQAASALLRQQLAQLEDNMDSAARGAGEVGMRALQANGQFLRQIGDDEGGGELPVPPPDERG